MAYFLGVDTGGTYTDAVIVDEAADTVIGKAKSLTTRQDLALGIGRAVDAALAEAGVSPSQVALVSLSTTLATNALIEHSIGKYGLTRDTKDKEAYIGRQLEKFNPAYAEQINGLQRLA